MKNLRFLICILLILTMCALVLGGCTGERRDEFLRLHIRADSNSPADQQVKLKVRDAVVEYLTPKLSGAKNFSDAKRILKRELPALSRLAAGVLESDGFDYGAEAVLTREEFPARAYGALVLDAGCYDALVINLGSGKGDNWWCVAYPPLCFVGEDGGDAEYKSLIKELISKRRQQ